MVEPVVSLREDMGHPGHADLIQAETHPVAWVGTCSSNMRWTPTSSDWSPKQGTIINMTRRQPQGLVHVFHSLPLEPCTRPHTSGQSGTRRRVMTDGYASRDRRTTIILNCSKCERTFRSVSIAPNFGGHLVHCIGCRLQERSGLDLKTYFEDQSWDACLLFTHDLLMCSHLRAHPCSCPCSCPPAGGLRSLVNWPSVGSLTGQSRV